MTWADDDDETDGDGDGLWLMGDGCWQWKRPGGPKVAVRREEEWHGASGSLGRALRWQECHKSAISHGEQRRGQGSRRERRVEHGTTGRCAMGTITGQPLQRSLSKIMRLLLECTPASDHPQCVRGTGPPSICTIRMYAFVTVVTVRPPIPHCIGTYRVFRRTVCALQNS